MAFFVLFHPLLLILSFFFFLLSSYVAAYYIEERGYRSQSEMGTSRTSECVRTAFWRLFKTSFSGRPNTFSPFFSVTVFIPRPLTGTLPTQTHINIHRMCVSTGRACAAKDLLLDMETPRSFFLFFLFKVRPLVWVNGA